MALSLVALALVHDAGECKTGDIPTPAKKLLRKEIGPRLDEVLGQFDVEPTDDLPLEYQQVLKCCDYLDSLLFLRENQVGRHAAAVMDDILQAAMAYFSRCGLIGDHATQLYVELRDAEYKI